MKYTFALITEAIKRVVNKKEKDNESLLDYLKHLKQGKEILKSHVNKDVLGHCVDNIDELKKMIGSDNKYKIKYK